MICIYELKTPDGHLRFDDEMKLNDFLLSRYKYKNHLGDVIYSTEIKIPLSVLNSLSRYGSSGMKLMADKRKLNSKFNPYIDDDIIYAKPFIGVTSAIPMMRGKRDNMLSPQFIQGKLFENIYNKAVEGKLSEILEQDDAEAIYGPGEDINQKINGNKDDVIKNIEDVLTSKWKFQGEFGNMVHDAMQLYFSGKTTDEKGNTIAIRDIKDKNKRRLEFERIAYRGKYFETVPLRNKSTILLDGQTVDTIREDVISRDMLRYIYDVAEKLDDNIKSMYPDCTILCEFPVYDDEEIELTDYSDGHNEKRKLMGSIDLLVIEKETGIPHIFDYKTSLKSYSDINRYGVKNAKVRTYTYQLGFYLRMLNRMGLNTNGSSAYIVPIQMGKLTHTKDENGKHIWRCNEFVESKYDGTPHRINSYLINEDDDIMSNIDYILPEKPVKTIGNEHFLSDVEKEQSAILPGYGYEWKEMTNANAKRIYDEKVDVDKNTGKLKLYVNKAKTKTAKINGIDVVADTPDDMIEMIKEYYSNKPRFRNEKIKDVRAILKRVFRTGEWEDIFDTENSYYKAKNYALNNKLRDYMDGNWFMIDTDMIDYIEETGLILLENRVTGQVDVIDLTNIGISDMYYPDNNQSNKLLTSLFKQPDIKETAKGISDKNMLKAYEGNIEIMKVMSILNNMKELFNGVRYIGNIRVINYEDGNELPVRNSDVMYSYNRLRRLANLKSSKGLKMADTIDLIKMKLMNIQTIFDMNENDVISSLSSLHKKGRYLSGKTRFFNKNDRNVASYYNMLEDPNIEKRLEALIDLSKNIENSYPSIRQMLENPNENLITNDTSVGDYQIFRLYEDIMNAIAEYKNMPMTQQLETTGRWSNVNIKNILRDGWSSTEFDNPGMMESAVLNAFSKHVMNAYQITRDEMNVPMSKIIKMENDMINIVNGGRLQHIFKNKEDMWNEMYVMDGDKISDKMMFKKPEEVKNPAIRGILRNLLIEINRYRYSSNNGDTPTDEEVLSHSNEEEYYQIPLILKKNGVSSLNAEEYGEKSMNKTRKFFRGLGNFLFGEAGEHTRETGFEERTKEIFGDSSVFRKELDGERREMFIKQKGVDAFDLDAAHMAISFILNNRLNKNIDDVIMMAKCAIVHLKSERNIINKKIKDGALFDNDIKWIMDYIRGRIMNEDINDENFKPVSDTMNKITNFAVKSTLGFSLQQVTYQSIQGMFTNASLCMRKVLGDNSFNKNDFERAAKLVYGDIKNDSNSVISLLNKVFGINDMDMNDYATNANRRADLTTSAGFWRLGMKFSSRPDYYNRMTIFVAQLIHDGVFDAYSVKDNALFYDFKKDKRFSKLVDKNASKDDEYYRQLALYRALARQMSIEGAIIPSNQTKSGRQEIFKFMEDVEPIDNPLPKPYTTQLSDAYKNVGNDTYGYYSSEQKALIHLRWIGNLFMQFRTYFSGKKNQYFMPGGVKMRGNYEHAKDDDGNYMYEVTVLNPDGEYDTLVMSMKDNKLYLNDEPYEGTVKNKIPLFKWKGMYQEGIALTLYKLMKDGILKDISMRDWSFKNFKNVVNGYKMNDDDSIRACYHNNMIQFRNDILMLFILGGLGYFLAMLVAGIDDDDEVSSIVKDSSMLIAKSVTAASLDFNAGKSFYGIFTNWTPMSISFGTRLVDNTINMFTGDADPVQWATSSFTAVRQFRATLNDLSDFSE